MSLKLKEEMNHLPLLDAWINDDDSNLILGWKLLQRTLRRLLKSLTLSFAS
jgi:hypothetical protein